MNCSPRSAGPSSSRRISRRPRRPSHVTPSGRSTRRTRPPSAQLEARWRTVESHATPDLQHEVAQHLERAREAFERHRQALEAEAEQQRAAALAAEEARRQRELEAQAAAEAAAEQARIREAEREAEREAARAKRAADDAEVRHLLGLLRQAQAALDHGGTARAARLREAIAEKLPQAPALPEWYARQLQQIDDKLEELKDWKTFRVVPKQAELVQRMQSLVGADISPEELARQIRQLRDEWRTLHRGAGEEPTPEWQQFDAAAERAYEPCREHFARQAEQRKENQQRREALLERLAAFAAEQDGEQPNWSLIRQVIFEARQEWQQYAPVDQSVVKPLQARFHAQLDELQARLDAEYARNVQAKRDMIARAAELATLEDTRQAIEESKSLQRAWKTVGLVPRHAGQRALGGVPAQLRRRVRAQLAGVGGARGRARGQPGAGDRRVRGTGAHGRTARRIVAPGDQAARRAVQRVRVARVAAGVRARPAPAVQSCDRPLRRMPYAGTARRPRAAAGPTCSMPPPRFAPTRSRPCSASRRRTCEALRESAASAVAGLEHAPKGTRALLEQQLEKVAAGAISADLAANEAALRLLCIRAELISDTPTPPEDLPLRREYQMQRLVASMGRGERATATDLDGLALEWLAVGPVEAAVHDALFARFERCRTARISTASHSSGSRRGLSSGGPRCAVRRFERCRRAG